MSAASPALAAWEIGVRLRKAREAARLTSTEVAKAIGISQNYVSNFEHGRRNISEDKLRKLAEIYELTTDELDGLINLRATYEQRGWWQHYGGILAADLVRFLGYEHGARQVQTYEHGVVSGLLQTDSYARAVLSGDSANLRKSEVQRRLEARQKRKNLLTAENPLHATIIMSEAALHQQVGGAAVLSEQLAHLLDLIDEHSKNLELRIVPFSAGSHGALSNSTFHILTFPSPELPSLAWQENGIGMDLIDDQPRVHQYSATFAEAVGFALDTKSSQDLIRTVLNGLT